MQLRNEHLLFRLQIDDAGHGRGDTFDLRGFAAQHGQIGPKQLDGNLGSDAGHQMVNAMRDGLADVDDNTGICSKRARMSRNTSFFGRFEVPSSTSISEECTPSAWSSSSARPVRLPVR